MLALESTARSLGNATGNLATTPGRIATVPFSGRTMKGEAKRVSRKVLSPMGNALLTIPGLAALYLLLSTPADDESTPLRLGKAVFAGIAGHFVLEGARAAVGVAL